MNVNKRILTNLVVFLMAFVVYSGVNSETAQAAPAKYPVLLKINDYYVLYTTPKPPYVDAQNRMMIPLRSVSELIGAKVSYNSKSKTAVIKMNDKTVTFTIGSKKVTTNGTVDQMDTVPVLNQNSMFIPISVLAARLGIQSNWDQTNHLYTLTGENLMQTDMIKLALEDIEGGAWTAPPGTIVSNNAFRPVSYTVDSVKKNFTIRAKNITGADVPEGAEDVSAYLLTDESVMFPDRNRARPAVKKDGTIEVGVQNGSLTPVKYLLVKGRLLDRSAS